MNDTTRLECLRAGYLQTGSMYADLLDVALSREELVLGQVSCLGKFAGTMSGADCIRLYGLEANPDRPLPREVQGFLSESNGAIDLEFSGEPRLLEFLADSGRLAARVTGQSQVMPSYEDLLCFFSHWDRVPVDWHNENTPLHYLLKPKKGMNKRAVSELQKFLKANPEGCVLSVSMTAFRSAVAVFPGADAVEHVWNRMTNLLRKDGSLS